MVDLVKPGNKLNIDYYSFGTVGNMPYEIVGSESNPQWNFESRQCAFGLQNLSGGWIAISDDKTASNGIHIPNNVMLTFDFDETWNGSLYAVAAEGGVVNVIMAIVFMSI